MSFEKLGGEVSDIIQEVEMSEFHCDGYQNNQNSELTMDYWVLDIDDDDVKAIGKAVMDNFWEWLDSLPLSEESDLQAQKTKTSQAIVRNYITTYLQILGSGGTNNG